MFKNWVSILLLVSVFTCCTRSEEEREIAIIPVPSEMLRTGGEFVLKKGMKIGVTDKSLIPAAEYLRSIINRAAPFDINIHEGEGDITLSLSASGEESFPTGMAGAYRLVVNAKGIHVWSGTYQGIITAVATIRQLFPPEIERSKEQNKGVKFSVPCVEIQDSPRFAWRGIHVDASRHFWTTGEMKRILDLMALYKFNKLHWHLTDDQGWRIEIKRYPLLTEKGAWRKYNDHDLSCLSMARSRNNPDFLIPEDRLKVVEGDTLYGGNYSQEEIKEIVAYAARLGIDVVPEIDMPGHFLAAIHQYPALACSDKIGWGNVFSSPICPGKDGTLEFCKNVYREVFELFPYEFVHLGADEVEKDNWKKCPDCQRRIRAEKLKNEVELQSWFVHEMEYFFNEHGKRLIGWDEIVEGGLSQTAAVMWWRSWARGGMMQALKQGNQVIVCPNNYFYFNTEPDKNTMKSLLGFHSVLDELSSDREGLIMGVQGNHWAEWIPSFDRFMYLAFPRTLALSELAWGTAGGTKEEDFNPRMASHLERLSVMGVNYRMPDLEGFYDMNTFTDQAVLDIACVLPDVEIRYTTDGSVPTAESPRYTGPIMVTETTDFTFRTFRPNGTPADITRTKYVKSAYSEADASAKVTGTGLKVVWHDFKGACCAGIKDAPIVGEYVVETVSIPQGVCGNIGLEISGYLDIPADGVYTFALLSDDGSTMTIDSELLIDNDGEHAPREVIAQKALKKGLHPVYFLYFDHNGGVLQLYTFNEQGEKIIWPREWLKH